MLLQWLTRIFFLFLRVTNADNLPRPLSAAEERVCLEAAAKGDEGARNRLIECNLRLVAHLIKKYYPGAGAESEDLLSIGTIGLIKAVDTYTGGKGARLATYASRCIENEILMYFRANKKLSGEVSMNEPIDTDSEGNALTLMEVICAEDTVTEVVELRLRTERLERALQTVLSPREREIVEARYGLGETRAQPQREVAERLGISRSYVSRIEKAALGKLRAELERPEK